MRRYLPVFLIILLSLFAETIYPWGEKGHKAITKRAIELLPREMGFFKQWAEQLAELSVEPDRRRNSDSSEYPKHFIDIDYYDEFNRGNMITDRNKLIGIYGDSIVTAMGILPWTIMDTYDALVKAMREKNRDKILILAGDISHYTQDAHQPMHTILNYDGQLTNQKGIHGRYESRMVDRYLNEITSTMKVGKPFYIENLMKFVFDFITESHLYYPILFNADQTATTLAGSTETDEYYRLLWFRTQYLTVKQFSDAALAQASILYSAWVDAGKPGLDKSN